MLLLKGFFRKKSTKIYLIIYSIIIATIICSFSLVKYNKKVINEITKELSYITMTNCTNDYYSEILNLKNVTRIERILLFEPDDSCATFKHRPYTIVNKDGTLVNYNNDDESEKKANWEDYTQDDNKIYIMPDKDSDLKNNEIALSIKGIEYLDSEIIRNLIGQRISFIYNGEKVEFVIKEIYDSKNPEMKISEKRFNDLLRFDNYSYKIYIDDYLKVHETAKQLESINYNNEIKVTIHYVFDGENGETSAENLLNIFQVVSFITIIIFIFIFFAVSKNILADEIKCIKLERMLGYNKSKLRKYSALKILLLYVLAVIMAIIISVISVIIINITFNFKIKLI